MYLIQILLPLQDNKGKAFPASKFADISRELTEKFGGVTAYARSPASGYWENANSVKRDDIIIIEVMVKRIGQKWWRRYQLELEKIFRQEEIMIRAHKAQRIGRG